MWLAEGKQRMLIDVSMTIEPGAVFRLGTPAVEIASHRFYHESVGEYESTMISFSAHTATHVDLVFMEKRIDPGRMIGPGQLINVTQASGGIIRLDDVRHQVEIEGGDFVFLRTDWSEFAGTMKYHDHPELSLEVVQWLASRNINAVGIDALGLGRDGRHGEYDRLLARNDIFVIENLTNLSAIPQQKFNTYCFPLKIENTDAIPARVVVEIDENG
jgi:kynurenine formamidase